MNLEKVLLENELKLLETDDNNFDLKYSLSLERLELLRLKELDAIFKKLRRIKRIKKELEEM